MGIENKVKTRIIVFVGILVAITSIALGIMHLRKSYYASSPEAFRNTFEQFKETRPKLNQIQLVAVRGGELNQTNWFVGSPPEIEEFWVVGTMPEDEVPLLLGLVKRNGWDGKVKLQCTLKAPAQH